MKIRKQAKTWTLLFLAVVLFFTNSVIAGAVKTNEIPLAVPSGVNLAALGDWDIVLAKDASPSEVYAAEEFQTHFAKASGINLPIVRKSSGPYHVFIGPGSAMRGSDVGFSTKKFGEEDFRIIVRNNNIAIAGGRPRGTLYGVYTFLEDYMGVRFLTSDHTYVPKIRLWKMVEPVDRFYHPPLRYRYCYYYENMVDPAFATRIRVNTIATDPKLGGKTGLNLINHSFYRQLSVEKYGKEHPEYFALVDGERKLDVDYEHQHGPQLCLTNPDVLRIVTESVLNDLRNDPNLKNISVSQNDNISYCQCPSCAAIDEREGTSMGSLLTFVNSVADDVAKEFPDVMVGTLSYQYTRKPPRTVRPRPNVQIQLCSIECCLFHPIDDPKCEKNKQFCADMANWSKLCDNISIWSYSVNFVDYLLPCPNLRALGPNIKYFTANNAIGIFMQAAGNTQGAEISDLRNYIISKLLWNPNLNGQKLMDEFIDLHYGRAAEPIRRFINLTHDNALASGLHPHCIDNSKEYPISEAIAQAGLDAFAEAMKLAENELIRSRVEKASICAYRAAIEPVWTNDKSSFDPARMKPLVKKFLQLCKKYNVTREGVIKPLEPKAEELKQLVGL